MDATSPPLFPDFDEVVAPDSVAADSSTPDTPNGPTAPLPGVRRLRRAEREQAEFLCESLDQLLPLDDPARLVWQFVEELDLSPLLLPIRAVEGHVGRDALDPRIPMALWIMATIDACGSARELEKLCTLHLRYRWICGGASVNYHSLSDFRSAQPELLEKIIANTVASLMHEGLVTLTEVAQDGMRVRASAGSSSFRREPTLRDCLEKAEAQIAALKAIDDAENGAENASAASERQRQARQRAAQDRKDRVDRALQQRNELLAQRTQQKAEKGTKFKPEELRASTTDPDARKMKMPDGGTRPAYNFQFATDTEAGIIVGVDVTNSGSDSGQMGPMLDSIVDTFGKAPDRVLVDGGFATLDDIDQTQTKHETKVFAPIKNEKAKLAKGENPYDAKKTDAPSVADWRERMGTAEAKAIYKRRAQAAEWANAGMRQRGLYQVLVRGLAKVKAVASWHVIAHNLLRAVVLRASKA
jgi:transposase